MQDTKSIITDETNARYALLERYEEFLTSFNNYRMFFLNNKISVEERNRANNLLSHIWSRIKNYKIVKKMQNYPVMYSLMAEDRLYQYEQLKQIRDFFDDALHSLGILDLERVKRDPGEAMNHYA